MLNTFVLSNLACGGKTSLMKALKWELQSRFPDKTIIECREPVLFTTKIAEFYSDYKDKSKTFKKILEDLFVRETAITAAAIAQIVSLKEFIGDEKYLIIQDRNVLDCFIYFMININFPIKEYLEDLELFLFDLEEIFGLPHKFFTNLCYYFVIKPPKEEVLDNCFKSKIRKLTLNKDEFYQQSLLFNMTLTELVNKYQIIEHPNHNSYTLYNILNTINAVIRGKDDTQISF